MSLRLLVVIILGTLLLKLIWDAWAGGKQRPVAVGALLLMALGLGALEYRAQAAERRLGQVASELAGRSVHVRCEGFFGELVDIGPELGTVRFNADGTPTDRTDLIRSACQDLKDYAGGDRELDLDAAYAVHTLAHEAVHLRGVRNEAQTECISLQLTAETARHLGATAAEGQALAEFYWREVYHRLPREYQHSECRPGGALDSAPEDPQWP